MIYVTGDTHGSPARLSPDSMPFARDWTRKDTLIICGDFGYILNGSAREELWLRELSFRPYTILFLDGNHENFDMLSQYELVVYNGGQAHKIRRNIFHLMRGEVFELEGHTVFAMGGGDSIDKARRYRGVDWWPQEMPSQEEYARARDNLKARGMRVDYVLTHAAPESTMSQFFRDHQDERPLNDFLQWVKDSVAYKRWYFGHLHMDAALEDQQYATFLSVRELTTGELLW